MFVLFMHFSYTPAERSLSHNRAYIRMLKQHNITVFHNCYRGRNIEPFLKYFIQC